MYLFFIAAVANCNDTKYYLSVSVGEKSSLRVSNAKLRVLTGLHFLLEALWKNLFPGSFRLLAEFSQFLACRTEVPFSC